MALKLRKDIKKSSYYVWFLGAKESKGLRGSEYIIPVIKHLEEREKDVEPFKVTLQVSHKGLKIIQNIVSQPTNNNNKSSKPKNETIKHFIPHNTITCVYQHEDIIACILLLFNPVTKCPLHVHAYRCDSLETATLLKSQLEMLIERPENQKKFADIEGRLLRQQQQHQQQSMAKSIIEKDLKNNKKKKNNNTAGTGTTVECSSSDTGASTRESESSEERYAVENTRVTTLYDSVAAELRAKLGKKNSPILLPPRDYDTVHRTKGNLTGIELRRCLNANIVGQNVINNTNTSSSNIINNNNNNKATRLESSGGSSGIGSDHPPSPESPDTMTTTTTPDSRFNTLDNQSTSDEDWNGDPADSTVYLMHHQHHQPLQAQVTLPRPSREKSPPTSALSDPIQQRFSSRYADPIPMTNKSNKYDELEEERNTYNKNKQQMNKSLRDETQKYLEKPQITKYADNKFQKSMESRKMNGKMMFERQKSFGELEGNERRRFAAEAAAFKEKQTSFFHDGGGGGGGSEKFYFHDVRKDGRMEKDINNGKPFKYFEDDGFDENIRYRSKSTDFEGGNNNRERMQQRYSYDDENDEEIEEDTAAEYFVENHHQHPQYRRDHRPVPKTRTFNYNSQDGRDDDIKYHNSSSRYHRDPEPKNKSSSSTISTRYLPHGEDDMVDGRYYHPVEVEDTTNARATKNNSNLNRASDIDRQKTPRSEYYDETNGSSSTIARRMANNDDVVVGKNKAPRDRFKDAKEKFLLMERERLEMEQQRQQYHQQRAESPISPIHLMKENNRSSRQQQRQLMQRDVVDEFDYSSASLSRSNNYDDRYYDEERSEHHLRPKPAPRQKQQQQPQHHDDVVIRYRDEQNNSSSSPIEPNYRRRQLHENNSKYDPLKRRSMFAQIEDEHRKNSNEIAKELKRRSYIDFEEISTINSHSNDHLAVSQEEGYKSSKDMYMLDDHRVSSSQQKFIKNQKVGGGGGKNSPAGYRHSYAEPKMRMDQHQQKMMLMKNGNKHYPSSTTNKDNMLLHRTNSSVGHYHLQHHGTNSSSGNGGNAATNNGRVGIASVHPY